LFVVIDGSYPKPKTTIKCSDESYASAQMCLTKEVQKCSTVDARALRFIVISVNEQSLDHIMNYVTAKGMWEIY